VLCRLHVAFTKRLCEVKMHGEPHGVLTNHDRAGRFTRGNNARDGKLIRIAAKAEELRREFFPSGGETTMDANRLQLAARHFVTAESHRDPVVAQRATRIAEFLLSKIKRHEAPLKTLKELERRYKREATP
jgi:hypothetical protein